VADTLNTYLQALEGLLGRRALALYLAGPQRQRWHLAASRSLPGHVVEEKEGALDGPHPVAQAMRGQIWVRHDRAGEAALIIPIVREGEAIGGLWIGLLPDEEPSLHMKRNIQSLLPLASSLALAGMNGSGDAKLLESENSRLQREMAQRLRETNALIEVGQSITSILDMDDLLAHIVDEALKAVPSACKGAIHLLEGEILVPKAISEVAPDRRDSYQMRVRGGIKGVGGTAFLGMPNPSGHLQVGEGILGCVALGNTPLYVPDVRTEPRFIDTGNSKTSALLVAPLLIHDKPIGTLSIESQQRDGFTPEHQRLLVTLANQAAIAIRNAQMTERLRVSRDHLSRRTAELEEIRATLEDRVQQRTRELRQVNASLEEKIKELRKARQQLVQSEKMASLGVLSAGIAHEINNPIGFIQSNLGMLQTSVADLLNIIGEYHRFRQLVGQLGILKAQTDAMQALEQRLDMDFLTEDLPQLIADAREGTQRVKTIVQDLKEFSRTSDDSPQPFDINREMEIALRIAHNEIKYVAEVEKLYGDVPLVKGVAPQLNQVLVNLLVNAAQAIGQKGAETQGKIRVRTFAHNGTVNVEIADTGVGIAQENLTRIFDPFFTTKKVGQGTGLGLSISYSIVQRMGGAITVRSRPGQGTMFCVALPAVRANEIAAPQK